MAFLPPARHRKMLANTSAGMEHAASATSASPGRSSEKRTRECDPANEENEAPRATCVKLESGTTCASADPVPAAAPALPPQPTAANATKSAYALEDDVCAPVPGAADPDPGPLIPRSEFQFQPKCGHRHPLKRSPCAAGSAATDDEPLLCDGACGKEIRPSDPRWSCYPCDYDLCELCLLTRSGGAAYIGLLAAEERKVVAERNRVSELSERVRVAESKLAAAERAAKDKAGSVGQAAERRAAEAKANEARVRDAEEKAAASEAEVARLQKEVVERRQRSKANLEKMYAAQKERDEARALVGQADEAHAQSLAAQSLVTEEAQRQLGAARQQLACAFGDDEALAKMASRDELESLQTALLAGLQRINERCSVLSHQETVERTERANCAVCLTEMRAVAFAPCGHVACCRGCSPKVDTCPLCKRGVGQRVNVFLP